MNYERKDEQVNVGSIYLKIIMEFGIGLRKVKGKEAFVCF